MPSAPHLLSLLGPSGAGKTTLAAALVARWSSHGLRVGYLKHASHGFEMDRTGKDTDRLACAGAAGVAVTGPGGTAYLERGTTGDPRTLVQRFFAGHDVVVLEGFRRHGFPAVVVCGDDETPTAVTEATGPVLAVVTPTGAAGTPPFRRDDIGGLAAHLECLLGVDRP